MTIILDQYTIPEQGSFEIRQTVDITFTAKQAQRKVDTWLLNEVSIMMGAEAPTLVLGARTVWRVGRVGKVGEVDVDTKTGEMYNTPAKKESIIDCAENLAKKLPPFRVRELPDEYLAKNLQPTHPSGRPAGNPIDLITASE